jgi:hypothetical protein
VSGGVSVSLAPGVAAAVQDLRAKAVAADVPARIAAKDATVWGPDAEAEAAVRLGWVELARTSRELVERMAALRDGLTADGIDHVVLAGMGGSSLAPEVITRTAGVELTVLGRARRPAGPDRGGGQLQVRRHGGDRQPPPGLPAGIPGPRAVG